MAHPNHEEPSAERKCKIRRELGVNGAACVRGFRLNLLLVKLISRESPKEDEQRSPSTLHLVFQRSDRGYHRDPFLNSLQDCWLGGGGVETLNPKPLVSRVPEKRQ